MTFGTKLHEFLEAAMESPEARLRRNVDDIFSKVNDQWARANEEVRGLFGAAYNVDEMSLYFSDRDLLFIFVSKAVQRGWSLFNFAEDVVQTRPIPSEYTVEYWFLQHPGRTYRFELMIVPEGFSPYHQALHESSVRVGAPASLAHASFKVPGEMEYAAVVVALRNAGLEVAQHCTSSYGRFSYFLTEAGDERGLPTIKPRINLRDGGGNSGN